MDVSLLPSELFEILRASVKATTPTFDASKHGPSNTTNPRIRRLIEEILFSRRFILSYYIVLGALLLIIAAIHWTRKTLRWRKYTKTTEEDVHQYSIPSSSSSSTLQGTQSLPLKDDDQIEQTEHTPLLTRHELTHHISNPTARRVINFFRAHLTHQPRPIPAITAPVNVLPPNGTTLVILAFLGLNLFYLFYHVPLSLPMLFVLADRAGLCFVANLPILYILAAKTNQPLKLLTGWSYESLNIFHRRLGEWMIVMGTLHGAAMFGAFLLLEPKRFSLWQFLTTRLVLLGILALIAYLAIYISSIGWVRHLYYEVFLGLHIVLQIAALVFLFFHYHAARPYVIATFFIWALDRLVTRIMVTNRKFIATLEVAEDGDTVLLFCDIKISRPLPLLRLHMSHGWQAGQHVFVTIPGLGLSHQAQAHPFTIASPAPPSSMYQGTWPLQLTIRARDGFSKDLLAYAKFHQHTEIWLDGPYGSTEVLDAIRSSDRTCLIAGGSGIAVTYPLAWDLLVRDGEDTMISKRVVYKSGTKHVPSLVAKSISLDQDKCMQLWVRQDPSHQRWITMFPRHAAIKTLSTLKGNASNEHDNGEDADETVSLITSTFETRSTSGGRPDIKTELREWVLHSTPSLSGVKNGDKSKPDKICVVVSGPDGLVRDVRNGAASLVRAGHDIEVHVEKFGW